MATEEFLSYKRCRFRSKLPYNRSYLKSHYWLLEEESGVYRIGLSKFSTRMVGELVEFSFDCESQVQVEQGEVIGFLEGFKATADIYVPLSGTFLGANADLDINPEAFSKDPYESGWLYRMQGQLEGEVLDVHGYAAYLDATIDRIQEEKKAHEEGAN
ncbi:MAG: glycine cleavage system protein H [Planctomycetes bacterium]|nr:glycine cleavage system protein H [Planctomycetota bacterium]